MDVKYPLRGFLHVEKYNYSAGRISQGDLHI